MYFPSPCLTIVKDDFDMSIIVEPLDVVWSSSSKISTLGKSISTWVTSFKGSFPCLLILVVIIGFPNNFTSANGKKWFGILIPTSGDELKTKGDNSESIDGSKIVYLGMEKKSECHLRPFVTQGTSFSLKLISLVIFA